MASVKNRLNEFEFILSEPSIDIERLRKLTFRVGCPDDDGIRSIVWKVLLNYLPIDRSKWHDHLRSQRLAYSQFIDDFIVKPGAKRHESLHPDTIVSDHPLNDDPESSWSQYFQDNEMLVQIDKDCRRLCPGLQFFQSACPHTVEVLQTTVEFETLRQRVERTCLKAQSVSKNRYGITSASLSAAARNWDEMILLEDGKEAHWEVAKRILFIFAKLNPGQGYVQGMNEIIGPIYFTLAQDKDKAHQVHAEADTFWCFTNLMGEIRDNFIKHLDNSSTGIGRQMDKLMETLKGIDTRLWLKLNEQEIRPQYYAFRWLTLLLSQEFELPNVLRLWDSLFADKDRFNFLIYVCCAMLILKREDLFNGDFATNMKLVQNYPSMDIHIILAKAVELAGMR